MKEIHYKSGYKYQLYLPYSVNVGFFPLTQIDTPYIIFDSDGELFIRSGYAWDGPSGPTIDTKNFMRGSLVHDALYQLIREGHLDQCFRPHADKLLHQMCIEDGMSRIRAWWVYYGVKYGASFAADPAHKRKIIVAP